MTIGYEFFCAGEVFGFGVVAHVDHDGVVEAGVGGCVDRLGGLGVVEVEGDGDAGLWGIMESVVLVCLRGGYCED